MRYTGERIDLRSTRSFTETVNVFDANVPAADLRKLDQLVTEHATAEAVDHAVNAMAGDVGFMTFAKIEQGRLVSLLGGPKNVVVYLLGNPVLAKILLAREPATGVYAPLRLSIYEGTDGATHVTYDQPSTLLGQFDDAQIRATAELLDDKMTRLADSVVH